jgi:hypothetical protein
MALEKKLSILCKFGTIMALGNNDGISCEFGTIVHSRLLPRNRIEPSAFSLQLLPCLYPAHPHLGELITEE